jgi:hypothetical protein
MEQTNQIPFAYLHLMKKEGVKESDLDSETREYIKDLNQVTQVLINRAKGGEIKVSSQTERKIKNYDRVICDGIYDYLEERENQPTSSAKEEEQLKQIYNKQKGGDVDTPNSNSEAKGSLDDIDLTPNEITNATTTEESESSDGYVGFWDWN